MTYDRNTVRTLYKKLLTFYPQGFREQLGESMEQTFNDLCNERKTGQGLFGFVLWAYVETAAGIVKEHVFQIIKRSNMNNTIIDLRSAAIISLILVLPFAILELTLGKVNYSSFPIALFGFLWLLPVAFIIILMPIVRNARAGNDIMASPAGLLLRVVLLSIIAFVWASNLIDQMPCFLGVPNCD